MKQKMEIKSKMLNLMERCLRERKKKNLLRSPNNCKFNDKLRIHNNGSVGVCLLSTRKASYPSGIFVCDSQETCENCKDYFCKNTEESVEKDFNDIIRNPSICGKEYPKLAILLWVLEGGDCRKPKLTERIKSMIQGIINGR